MSRFRSLGTLAAFILLACGTAWGQAYPTKPVRVIIVFPPGGATDIVGRIVFQKVGEQLGQQFIIDNRGGANGIIGMQYAAAAKPDGYTLLLHIVSISGFAEVDKLFDRKPKFTRADFIPIARFTQGPMALVVNDKQPYKTLKELVADAKKRPNGILFSSSGLYGALHLPMALFMQAAGIQMRHLPTAGGGPALNALLGNNSQVLVSSVAAANAQAKAGKVRALACFSSKRAASMPDVPTMKELGYDVEFYLWVGLFAPKGTPQAIVDRINREVRETLKSPDVQKRFVESAGGEAVGMTQEEFLARIKSDAERYKRVVQKAGVKPG